jgi:hypothetical protein
VFLDYQAYFLDTISPVSSSNNSFGSAAAAGSVLTGPVDGVPVDVIELVCSTIWIMVLEIASDDVYLLCYKNLFNYF